MPLIQANRSCEECRQPYEPSMDKFVPLASAASEERCHKCENKYSDEVIKAALQRNAQKLYTLQERRKNTDACIQP